MASRRKNVEANLPWMAEEAAFVQNGLLCVEEVADKDEDDILPYRNCYAVVRLEGSETEERLEQMTASMHALLERVRKFELPARKAMEKSAIPNLLVYDECAEESCFEHQERALHIYKEHKKQIPLIVA